MWGHFRVQKPASRSADVIKELLPDFTGYLHCDGYQGYDAFAKEKNITQVGCMYHCRRKFTDTQKASKKKGVAGHVIRFIKELAKIEAEIKDSTSEAKFATRQAKSLLGKALIL